MKYCIGCVHLNLFPHEPGYSYSTYTQESYVDAKMACAKHHWEVAFSEYSSNLREEFEKAMEKAETCKDFEERSIP